MKLTFSNKWIFTSLLALGLLTPSWTVAQMTFERIVVFGTSISDPGNAFALLSHTSHGLTLIQPQNTPPYDTLDELLIPGAPYAKGGHHFSNGATWIEQFAQGRGLAGNVRPAFQGNSIKATNYAVGGARATPYPGRVNLPDQINAFRSDYPQQLPYNALYVVEMGSNDVRDALATAAAGGNPSAIIASALAGISQSIQILYSAGGRKFLVVNVPNLALLPAVKALGSVAAETAASLAQAFNTALAQLITSLPSDIEVTELDTYNAITNLYDFPENYGLTDVNDPCVTPNIPPFTCQTPDTFLFWDGIHPTKAVHAILAQKVATVLSPDP